MNRMDLYIRSIELQKQKEGWAERLYPFYLPIVKELDELTFENRVTFLVGENGTGKSTLMEALAVACGFNAEGGSRNFTFSSRATHSVLHEYLKVIRGVKRPKDGYFLRAESFYNLASNIEDLDDEDSFSPKLVNYYGGTSLHEQSHGESFMALMQHRFSGKGLYLLDEPEAALSPTRQMALIPLIRDLADQDSQFIIATHSPILLGYPGAHIYALSEKGIRLTPYEETEHYLVTRRFLNDRESMLRYLLS